MLAMPEIGFACGHIESAPALAKIPSMQYTTPGSLTDFDAHLVRRDNMSSLGRCQPLRQFD